MDIHVRMNVQLCTYVHRSRLWPRWRMIRRSSRNGQRSRPTSCSVDAAMQLMAALRLDSICTVFNDVKDCCSHCQIPQEALHVNLTRHFRWWLCQLSVVFLVLFDQHWRPGLVHFLGLSFSGSNWLSLDMVPRPIRFQPITPQTVASLAGLGGLCRGLAALASTSAGLGGLNP